MDIIPVGQVVNGDDTDEEGYTENSYITIFGRSVNTIDTTMEQFVNIWITEHTTRGSRHVVGLHLEVRENARSPPSVETLSICVNGECLIHQMFAVFYLPTCLKQLITDPHNAIVGVNLERKLQVLNNRFQCNGRIPYSNLGSFAARRFQRPSLLQADISELSMTVLGRNLVMPLVDPDWDRPKLTLEQVLYASVTAYVSYEMGMTFFIL